MSEHIDFRFLSEMRIPFEPSFLSFPFLSFPDDDDVIVVFLICLPLK